METIILKIQAHQNEKITIIQLHIESVGRSNNRMVMNRPFFLNLEEFFYDKFNFTGRKGSRRRDIWRGESRKFSTSLILLGDRISLCGWNVLACFEKMFSWSNSDVVQLPSSLRKAGGGCYGYEEVF
jgi:hypothetical protein